MKHQARSTKSKANSKFQISNSKHVLDFGFWILDFQQRERPAFTLLEMVVSFGIFATVIVIAIGAMLAVNTAQIKAANIQNIQDNLRFTLESMTKEMRTGKSFQPSGGSPPAYTAITFTRSDSTTVSYCLEANAVKKVTGGANCPLGSAVTGDNILVEQLIFYVIGHGIGPADGQPRTTISLRARSRDPKLATAFRLQTTVVQRERDR